MKAIPCSTRTRISAALLVCLAPAAGCGSSATPEAGTDTPANQAPSASASAPANGNGNGTGSGPGDSLSGIFSINPETMPPSGTIEVKVDGETFTYAQAEADSFDCEVSPERFELVYQENTGHHALRVEYGDAERVGGKPGTWLGTFTMRAKDLPSDAGYSASGPLAAPLVKIDPPYLYAEVPQATFSESRQDLSPRDAGLVIVRATCPDR